MRTPRYALPSILLACALGAPPATAQQPADIVEEEIFDESSPIAGTLADLESRAEQLFADDELEAALAIYRQLAEIQPTVGKRAEALVFVAWIEHLSERDDAAAAALTEALVVKPDLEFRSELFTEDFRVLFLEAQEEAVEKREVAAFEAVERGLERMRGRDYVAARQEFGQALEVRPGHPQALFNLALVALREGEEDEALAGFQRLVALAESRPDEFSPHMRGLALTNVGYLYNRRQLFGEAEMALEKAVALYPENASAWSNLGVSRRRLGKKVAAAEAFRRAHELSPDDAGVVNNLALAYIDNEDWVSAVALLKGATERFGDNSSLWLNFGLAQLGLGNADGGIRSFESAIRSDPENRQGWASAAAVHLAKHYLATGDHARTLSTAERILGWRGDSVDGWSYKGLAERELGRLEAARASLERARALDPTRAETHNNLGSVYFELGMPAEAAQAFQRALAVDPNLAEARSNLAAVEATQASSPASGAAPPAAPLPPPPPPRARLGLKFADIDYSALGLKGVMVEAVVAGTLASRADLRPDDLILKVDGRDVSSPEELERYVRETGKKSVVLDLLRDNRPQRVELRLE